jgi:tripartite-type tricarboxylate transporter receptor subunit TctC
LAATTKTRISALPDVPPLAENGFPDYDLSAWCGILAPPGTPAARVDKLSAAVARAMRRPDIVKRLQDKIIEPVGSTPAEFAKAIADSTETYRKIVMETGITLIER